MKSKEEQRTPHLGYMGHLWKIGNAIVKSSKQQSAVFYLLDDVPNRGWKKFTEKLNQVNALMEQPSPPPPSALTKKSQFKMTIND
jgi:hypothetical protein